MATITTVVRWADNTADLKRNLSEGLNQIEATRASAEKMVQALSGDKLVMAAHKYVAAVEAIGGAERLNAQEKERINALVTKAIEKYTLFGKVAPDALHRLADATKQAEKSSSSLLGWIGNLATQAGTMAAGFLSAQAIMRGVSSAFSFVKDAALGMNATLETTTLKFTTLMGDSDKAKAHVKDLFEIAKKTPFETGPIIEASLKLQTFGGAALNTKANIMLLGDASAATGAPIQDLGFWVGRMYAMLQGGKPFGEAAMRLQELAVLTPQARDQMEAMQKAGKSAAEIFDVFQKSLKKFTGAMEEQAGTWQGVVSTFTDTINMLIASTFKPYFEVIRDLGREVNVALEGMSDQFDNIAASADASKASFVAFVQSGLTATISAMSFLMVEFNAALVVFRNARQVIEGDALAFEYLALGIAHALNIGPFAGRFNEDIKRINTNIDSLLMSISKRGESLQKDKQAEKDWVEWGKKAVSQVDALTSRIGHSTEVVVKNAAAHTETAHAVQKLTADQKAYAKAIDEASASNVALSATDQLIVLNLKEREFTEQQIARLIHAKVSQVKQVIEADKEAAAMDKLARSIEFDGLKKSLAAHEAWSDGLAKISIDTVKRLTEAQVQIQSAHKKTADFIAQQTLSSTDYQVEQIWAVVEQQKAAFNGSIAQREKFNAAVDALAKKQTSALYVDNKALVENSNATLRQIADKAWTTYLAMRGAPEEFSKTTIAHFRKIAQKAEAEANHVKRSWTSGLSGIAAALTQLAQISDGAFGNVARAIGSVIATMEVVDKSVTTFKEGLDDIDAGDKAEGFAEISTSLIGMVAAMDQATSHASKLKNVLHGALVGAQIGAQFGGAVGAAIGAAAGGLIGFFRSILDRTERDIQRLGKNYGVTVSKAMVDAVQSAMESISKGGLGLTQQAATIFNADKLFPTVTIGNLSQAVKITRDVFSMIQTGQLTVAQGTQVLDSMFPRLAKAGTDAYGFISESIKELIRLNRQYGTESDAIASFMKQQTANITSGFNAIADATVGPFMRAIETMGASGDKLVTLNEQAEKLAASIKDLERSGIKTDKQRVQLAIWQRQLADVQSQISELERANDNAAKAYRDAAVSGQESFARTGRLAVVAFAAAIASGQGFMASLEAIGPGLDILIDAMRKFGFVGSKALDQLLGFRKFANENKELVAGIDGLNQMMTGLANTGFLTQDVFKDLTATAFDFYQKSIAGGLTATQAMVLMQPTLQRIWQLHHDVGLVVDENTQKLLDEAEANGIVGDQMRSVNEQILGVLKAIAKVLGADLPAAAERFANSVPDNPFSNWKIPPIAAGVETMPQIQPDENFRAHSGAMVGAQGLQKFHDGTAQVLPFVRAHNGLMPGEVPAILQVGEAVLNRGAVDAVGTDAISAMNGGRFGHAGVQKAPGPIVVNDNSKVVYLSTLDTQSAVDALRDLGFERLEDIEDNRGGDTLTRWRQLIGQRQLFGESKAS